MAKAKITPDKTIVDMARNLKEIRDEVDSHEARIKMLEERAVPLERELVAHIAEVYGEEGGNSFDVSNTHKAILSTVAHPRILPGKDELVHDWLRQKGFPSAVKPYVFPQTLKKILKDMAEEKDVDVKDVVNLELLNVMEVFTERKITFRKKG